MQQIITSRSASGPSGGVPKFGRHSRLWRGLISALICLGIVGSSVAVVAPGAALAAAAGPEFTPVEKRATFTAKSAVKMWTVPEAVYGPVEVTISGAAGLGRMGGGTGAEFSFATERPGGESWTLLFGGQHHNAFATLSGGQGAGLPESWGKDSEWDITRSWGGNGGDATAIVAGAATCDSEGEVLAVAGQEVVDVRGRELF